MPAEAKPTDLVQGTLHMLILKTLALEPMHAYGIGARLEQISKGVFLVNAGSLFPALRRLERDGLIEGDWQVTENNRRAKVYRLTAQRTCQVQERGARLGGPDRRHLENPQGLTGRVVMAIFSRVIGGFRGLFQKNRAEQDLDDELREYLETVAEQKVSSGMSRDAAVRAARVEIGSVEAVKDRVRDVGWESVVESVWQDVRFAVSHAPQAACLHRGCGRDARARHRRHDGDLQRRRWPVPACAGRGRRRRGRCEGSTSNVTRARMQTPSGGPGLWIDYVAMRDSGPALAGVAAYLLSRARRSGSRRRSGAGARECRLARLPAACWGSAPLLGRLFVADDDGVARCAPGRRGQSRDVAVALRRRGRRDRQDPAGERRPARDHRRHGEGLHRHRSGRRRPVAARRPWRDLSGWQSADGDWRTVDPLARYVARLAPGAEDSIAARRRRKRCGASRTPSSIRRRTY